MRWNYAVVVVGLVALSCSSEVTNSDGGPILDGSIPTDVGGSVDGGSDGGVTDAPDNEDATAGCGADLLPAELRCTGLYASWTKRTLAVENLAYKPGYELWSDGAEKQRYIRLPVGKTIDVSQMDDWVFPIGTQVWKEFYVTVSSTKKLLETRYMVKGPDELWSRVSYVWSQDGSKAAVTPEGVEDVAGTDQYEVPTQTKCGRCHGGRVDNLLGVEAIALAAPSASGLTYATLQSKGLLSSNNDAHKTAASALKVPGTDVEQAALGYLHMNCGVSCHNPITPGAKFGMRLQSSKLATVMGTEVASEMINKQSSYIPPDGTGKYYRMRPLDSSRSTAYTRMGLRDITAGNGQQMPNLGSHVVDASGRAAVKAWIGAMTTQAGYPAPAAP